MRLTTQDQRFRAEKILNVLQIEATDTNLKQVLFFMDALYKFRERNAMYVDLWKDGGAEDSVRNAESKAARLKAFITAFKVKGGLSTPGPEIDRHVHEQAMMSAFNDDAIDLANYAAFAARNLHARRLGRGDGII